MAKKKNVSTDNKDIVTELKEKKNYAKFRLKRFIEEMLTMDIPFKYGEMSSIKSIVSNRKLMAIGYTLIGYKDFGDTILSSIKESLEEETGEEIKGDNPISVLGILNELSIIKAIDTILDALAEDKGEENEV